MAEEKEMTADELFTIFVKQFPKSFAYWYKECKVLWEFENRIFRDKTLEEEIYWENDAINFARAILYDQPKDFANKVGKILVAATEDK